MKNPLAKSIILDPFELHYPIAQGGMAEVWYATHLIQKTPVAVKVVLGEKARNPEFCDAFRNEVRTIAGLDHKNILLVSDYGEITVAAAKESSGNLIAGSPYLAMELSSGGTLSQWGSCLPWLEIKSILVQILDSLAHAHAKGVIHLDLKPGNILMSTEEDIRPGLKLSDFGISVVLSNYNLFNELNEEKNQMSTGTPAYMAPEQFLANPREFGPWTDLYALGCMTYKLVTGRLPFTSDSIYQLAMDHISKPPPKLQPQIKIPNGLEEWINILLEKRKEDRYQRAADAAWALMKIEDTNENNYNAEYKYQNEYFNECSNEISHINDQTKEISDVKNIGINKIQNSNDTTKSMNSSYNIQTNANFQTVSFKNEATKTSSIKHALATTSNGSINQNYPEISNDSTLAVLYSKEKNHSNIQEDSTKNITSYEKNNLCLKPNNNKKEHIKRNFKHIPPISDSWEIEESKKSIQLIGTGLNLFGFRSISLVGRKKERDFLWLRLKQTHEIHSPNVVILKGPTGSGKTRIAEWISQRAHELGSAITLKANHSPIQTSQSILSHLMQQELRCIGLNSTDGIKYIQAHLDYHKEFDPIEVFSLVSLIWENDNKPREHNNTESIFIKFSSPEERYALIHRYLIRISKQRPLLLWLDDVQWGFDTLCFVKYILDTQQAYKLPILIILTVQEEAIEKTGQEQIILDKILQHQNSCLLKIEQMDYDEQIKLVHELLYLEEDLANKVVKRTIGNPLFSIQLVGDWIHRKVLEVSPNGFVLSEGNELQLPDNIYQVWYSRIENIVKEKPYPYIMKALQLAAVLGNYVNMDEWRLLCESQNISFTNEILDLVLSQKLAEIVDTQIENSLPSIVSWSFIHNLLRESLLRLAQESNQLKLYHKYCANILLINYNKSNASLGERLALHYINCEDYELSLEPLLEASKSCILHGEYKKALDLILIRENQLKKLLKKEDDPAWIDGFIQQAIILKRTGQNNQSLALLNKAEASAINNKLDLKLADIYIEISQSLIEKHKFKEVQDILEKAEKIYDSYNNNLGISKALRIKATSYFMIGDINLAIPLLEKSLTLNNSEQDLEEYAKSCRQMGEAYTRIYKEELARKFLLEAKNSYEKLGNRYGVATCYKELGRIEAEHSTNLNNMRSHYNQATDILEKIGARAQLAITLSSMGDLERVFNELEGAEQLYLKSIHIFEEIGAPHAKTNWFNIAMIRFLQNDFESASKYLDMCEELLLSFSIQQANLVLYLARGLYCIEKNNIHKWDSYFKDIKQIVEQGHFPDLVDSWLITANALKLKEKNEYSRSLDCYKAAKKIMQFLCQEEKIKEIQEKIEELEQIVTSTKD